MFDLLNEEIRKWYWKKTSATRNFHSNNGQEDFSTFILDIIIREQYMLDNLENVHIEEKFTTMLNYKLHKKGYELILYLPMKDKTDLLVVICKNLATSKYSCYYYLTVSGALFLAQGKKNVELDSACEVIDLKLERVIECV